MCIYTRESGDFNHFNRHHTPKSGHLDGSIILRSINKKYLIHFNLLMLNNAFKTLVTYITITVQFIELVSNTILAAQFKNCDPENFSRLE